MKVFTARSTRIGIVTGVIVAAGLGQLLGVAWKLATLNGLAAGALTLALSTIGRAPSRLGFRPHDGRFGMMDNVRWPGVWALVVAVIAGPMFFVGQLIGAPWGLTAAAQEGSIAGRVLDAAGNPLPGVTVEIVGSAQGETWLEVTELDGRYRVDGLPAPRTYTVFFALPGFYSVVRYNVDVRADLVTMANTEMAIGRSVDSVSVSGPLPAGAATLNCSFLPNGVIADCRPVTR